MIPALMDTIAPVTPMEMLLCIALPPSLAVANAAYALLEHPFGTPHEDVSKK